MLQLKIGESKLVTAGADFITKGFSAEYTASQVEKEMNEYITQSKRAKSADPEYDGYSGSWAEVSGCKAVMTIFNSRDEAENWISNHAQKWENALAVRYKKKAFASPADKEKFEATLKKQIEENSRLKKLDAKAAEIMGDYRFVVEKLGAIKDVIKKKIMKPTSHIACPHCKSKVAKQFLQESRPHATEIPLDKRNQWYSGELEWEPQHLLMTKIPQCKVCDKTLLTPMQESKVKAVVEKLTKKKEVVLQLKKERQDKYEEIKSELVKKYAKEETPWLVGAWASS